MGFLDRVSRLLRSNLNYLVSQAEDPSKIIDQSVADMQNDLVRLRQAVAAAIASQKRLLRESEQAQSQANAWYQRAEQAMRNGEEDLSREALIRRKTFQESSASLSNQLKGQEGQVETLKRSLVSLEGKIAQALTKKEMLKARAQAAQAKQELESAVGNLGSNSAMDAFERMEEKVEELEASGEASAELAGADLESRFLAIENSEDIESELRKLKKGLNDEEIVALPGSEGTFTDEQNSTINLEIETVDVAELEIDSDSKNNH